MLTLGTIRQCLPDLAGLMTPRSAILTALSLPFLILLLLFRCLSARSRRASSAYSVPPTPIEKLPEKPECPLSTAPITTRTPEEIAAFGRLPDYAALSEVPLPQPYYNFEITRALPRPYRPFRWNYHQTMSFKKMEPDWWLELENTYFVRLQQRHELLKEHGSRVLDALPGSEAACRELMEMCCEFLAARYPHYFTLDEQTYTLHNRLLGRTFDLEKTPPLQVIFENIPEDFAIMLPNRATGLYELCGGFTCSSLGWTLADKLGKPLSAIHAPVPDYAEKMSKSMDRYFSRLPCHSPIQRGSWGLEHGQPLFVPPGSLETTKRNIQDPALQLQDIHLRVDWQTLRRLPLSGAIVFNYKALFTPVTEFRDEPGVPAVVLKCIEEGKRNIMEYKGTWHVEHVAREVLGAWVEEQKRRFGRGEDAGGREGKEGEEGWEVRTLGEYPWFEGWREKWHRQQGF